MKAKRVKLGDIATLQAGAGFPLNYQGKSHGQLPFAKVGDISRCGRSSSNTIYTADNYLEKSEAEELRAKIIPKGSIIFAKIGEAIRQNHRVIAGCDLLIDNNAMAAIPNNKVYNHFLFHFLKTVDFYALAPATTVPALRKSDLELIEIPLPPLPEQRRIAAILDKADALRAKRRGALAQLDKLAQAIFLEMFGDLFTNSKGFPLSRLGDACDVRDGTHDSPSYVTEGYPLVTSKNLRDGKINLSEVNFISEADYNEINRRSKVDIGDILMPMIGTIGNPVLVEKEPSFAIKNMALIKFKLNSPNREFILHFLRSDCFDRLVVSKNKGGTQKFLALGEIRGLPLPLPSEASQLEFSKRIRAINCKRKLYDNALDEIDSLFVSIQHRAFRGEL